MQEIHLGLGAFLGCVVLRMAVGALWYSPLLFLKDWQKISKVTDKQIKGSMARNIAWEVVSSVVLIFVLGHAVKYSGAHTVAQGLGVGFANWLGLVAVVQMDSYIHERKPFKYFLINSGYQFVTLLGAGIILAVWG